MAFLDTTGLTHLVSLIKSKFVPTSGDAGAVSVYMSVGDAATVNASAPAMIETDSAVTVENGDEGKAWTRIVHCTAVSPTVSAGDAWAWKDAEAPNLYAGGYLVCCWCGSAGILAYANSVAE